MLHQDLETLIDKAISQDFILHKISNKDRQNDSYKALKFTLSFNNIETVYERKVESEKYPVIPKYQYLFGFYPRDGLCVFLNKENHKVAACDGPLEDINNTCSLVHSLMYFLVPTDRFEVYSYLPACCELNCNNSPKSYELRINLFSTNE